MNRIIIFLDVPAKYAQVRIVLCWSALQVWNRASRLHWSLKAFLEEKDASVKYNRFN